ncbi:MAG: hypothetical protein Q7U02_08410 [Desulfosalsimonadaceae bacterium]|nr:hypothetical protein [Desulfosalsimonadaceae bacterium]
MLVRNSRRKGTKKSETHITERFRQTVRTIRYPLVKIQLLVFILFFEHWQQVASATRDQPVFRIPDIDGFRTVFNKGCQVAARYADSE